MSREPTSVFRTGAQPIDTLVDHLEWTKDRHGIHPIVIVQIQEDVTKANVPRAFMSMIDVVEKCGKKTLKFSVVE